MDAEAMVRPVVEQAGLELVEVVLTREGGRRVLRVTVDSEEQLGHDSLTALSERVSRRLDLEGFDPGSYGLEVSTPGIEHPLRTPGQYRRAVGGRVALKTRSQAGSLADSPAETIEGALVAANEEALVLSTAGGERRVPVSDVASARTVVDWDAELRRTTP